LKFNLYNYILGTKFWYGKRFGFHLKSGCRPFGLPTNSVGAAFGCMQINSVESRRGGAPWSIPRRCLTKTPLGISSSDWLLGEQ